jgi:hypothetical protein
MKTSDLVFIGIKGSVIALNRVTGAQVWAIHLRGSGFVNILVQPDAILACCYGEVFCLDPLTGQGRWQNPLTGFGYGLATIAVEGQSETGVATAMAEQRRRSEESAAAASSTAAA